MNHKILFFGTHPLQFNGYAKVVYELTRRIHGHGGFEMGIFGFQNFHSAFPGARGSDHRASLPESVYVFDAWAHEEPKQQGFGLDLIPRAIDEFKPDLCIVFNDFSIVTEALKRINRSAYPDMVIVYLDQVYLNQKKAYIENLNKSADAVIVFTEFWKTTIIDQGLTLPTYVLEHGFDGVRYFPIAKDIARTYLGLDQNDFLVLNLNRNQPRKRWDTCMKAWAEVVSRAPNSRMKLVIDLGINTCDGEGFGLCNFEHAALGIPQVVPRIGGFLDFFDDNNSTLVFPSIAYYVDSSRDSVGGEALMCSYTDFAIAIESYHNDQNLRKTHGDSCRSTIPKKYDWDKLAEKLSVILTKVLPNEKEEKKNKLLKEVARLQALLSDM
ncbi:hypothetical protein CEUSTIGMA_g12573.t1 [Chlamydomonas eustigma]|uniref:Glycosyl transferase family 1 domain-containing protein n=1 Tax=Chlamydomonas eustigma TaxID=1157962 RepID=A0A250XQ19_9CHLO|nr:hypothetical protein CEUSTIGMA_g12573.t1 [Chlamydomonas eustigma]|eukprot:GAX85155.1 hypothetical protein CEUSTIGMA_g12573.t1 [Chlamydomonas eustigma]